VRHGPEINAVKIKSCNVHDTEWIIYSLTENLQPLFWSPLLGRAGKVPAISRDDPLCTTISSRYEVSNRESSTDESEIIIAVI